MIDYPNAQAMFVDESRTFIDALIGLTGDQLSIVIHKTGGPPTINLANLASFFQSDANGANTHFGIDLDGTVGQFVWLKDGAAGNCCLEAGHDPYWDSYAAKYGNLNLCTISLEHIDPTQDNSTTPPQAQLDASFALVKWLVQKFGIPLDHIKTHASLDPINRARCPGNYPMAALLAFLASQETHMEQQFNDVWFSKAYAFKSGIYSAVLDAFRYHLTCACYPLGPEIKTVDWNGASIQFQALSNGLHAEWNNSTGACHLYDAQNRQVA